MKVRVMIEKVLTYEREIDIDSLDDIYLEVDKQLRDGKINLKNPDHPTSTNVGLIQKDEDGYDYIDDWITI